MGFRYRKSMNLGGGFRINFSKSGVGYSWGDKGYRVTKTAKGTTRTTYSLPGTGISYVEESGRGRIPAQQNPAPDNNQYAAQNIVNSAASQMVSEGLEKILKTASSSLMLKNIAVIGFWTTFIISLFFPICLPLAAFFGVMYVLVRMTGTVDLKYEVDADQQSLVDSRMKPMIQIAQCAKVWRVTQASKIIDPKYAAGAGGAINRVPCIASTYAPFPFKTNVSVASFKANGETLLFLPDKLLIIQGSKVGALNYSDISRNSYTTYYVESEIVPRDAQVAYQTWKFVNKSGEPDRRFKNNTPMPVCSYGMLELKSTSGLNTVIMYSNPNVDFSRSQTNKYCVKCGTKLSDGAKFCTGCGASLERQNNEKKYIYCVRCGEKLELDSRFCTRCGSPTK